MDPHNLADKATSWIISTVIVACMLIWAVYLIYSFAIYLWR